MAASKKKTAKKVTRRRALRDRIEASDRKIAKKAKRKPRGRPVRPRDIEPIYPWERQPKESVKAFAAFGHYLDTPPLERSVRGTMRALGKHWSQVGGWSSRHSWVDRAKAYDKRQDQRRRAKQQRAIDQMHERQANHAVLGQMASIRTLQRYVKTESNPDPPTMRDRDAIRMFDVMSRVEMRARGEPDTITEMKGKIGVTAEDNVDSTRSAMVELLENPKALEHMAEISKLLGTDGSNSEG